MIIALIATVGALLVLPVWGVRVTFWYAVIATLVLGVLFGPKDEPRQ